MFSHLWVKLSKLEVYICLSAKWNSITILKHKNIQQQFVQIVANVLIVSNYK